MSLKYTTLKHIQNKGCHVWCRRSSKIRCFYHIMLWAHPYILLRSKVHMWWTSYTHSGFWRGLCKKHVGHSWLSTHVSSDGEKKCALMCFNALHTHLYNSCHGGPITGSLLAAYRAVYHPLSNPKIIWFGYPSPAPTSERLPLLKG